MDPKKLRYEIRSVKEIMSKQFNIGILFAEISCDEVPSTGYFREAEDHSDVTS